MAGKSSIEKARMKGKWSKPLSLQQAVSRAPVIVRLLEGHRGMVEAESFSAGDIMALEGETTVRGCRLVLAHHSSKLDLSGGKSEIYRALVTLPYNNLPIIDVAVLEDPNGDIYSNYLANNFPDWNWNKQQQQLLDNLDDADYVNVSIIKAVSKVVPSKMQTKEKWTPPQKRRPPILPISTAAGAGDEAALTPPPRPPRTDQKAQSSLATTAKTIASDRTEAAPVIPPRRYLLQETHPVTPETDVSEPEVSFTFTSFAEMATVEGLLPEKSDVLPEIAESWSAQKDVTKKKTALDKMKKLKKKVYESMIKVTSRPQPVTEETPKLAVSEDDDDYVDIKDDYDVIDDNLMEAKQATSASVKPTVRVPPRVVKTTPASRTASIPHPLSPEGGTPGQMEGRTPAPGQSTLIHMTCNQLCQRLKDCGMPGVAKACREKSVDGALFVELSEDTLRKPPFSMDNFEVTFKLDAIKQGWVPRQSFHSDD